jgi:hypothetical protein
MKDIEVNGIRYVRADTRPTGNRAVIVVDRGWIFAGDIERKDGRIRISRAVWLFRWEKVGFAGVIADPSTADIRKIDDVDMPAGAEVFSVPVHDAWGL